MIFPIRIARGLLERIRIDNLFYGGYRDSSGTLRDIQPQLQSARYLLGHSETDKDGHPIFIVGGEPLSEMLIALSRAVITSEQEIERDLGQNLLMTTAAGHHQFFVVSLEGLFKKSEAESGFLSSRHYRSLIRNIMGQFPQKFEYVCHDNGVKYDEVWVIDRYGNELPPDLVEEEPLTSTGEGGYTRKVWFHPDDFICCACTTDLDGTVKLIYQCRHYELYGHTEPAKINELVRRRLWTIQHQVERKLVDNHLQYSDNLDGFSVSLKWETCSYYKGIRMQL